MRSNFRGCLLGGAVGDALGAPVEFMSLPEIRARFGAGGVADMVKGEFGGSAITDDTQMTLFTVEGLLRAHVRNKELGEVRVEEMLQDAYLRWLMTQDEQPSGVAPGTYSYLLSIPCLHKRRAPGATCLSALQSKVERGSAARNDSKGCGGIMRVAPIGLYFAQQGGAADVKRAFELGVASAALTHGHPTGQLASGVFAAIVQRLVEGTKLSAAIEEAERELVRHPHHDETLQALRAACALAQRGGASADTVESLGAGWVAEESLAIALYCALVADSFGHGVLLAVNHGGDSDSTASLVGQLLGAAAGDGSIPSSWAGRVELGWLVRELADDLLERHEWLFPDDEHSAICSKYPGC